MWWRRNWSMTVVALIFLVHLGLSYYGVFRYHYPVAPGDDISVHIGLAEQLGEVQKFWPTTGYPWGLHYFMAGVGKIFHTDTLTVTAYLWPGLLVLSAVAVYLFSKKLFGKRVGLVAYTLYALASLQPLQTATDGGLPNIVASGILIPLSLLCWVKLWGAKGKWWPLLGFLVSGVAVISIHHLSTIVWLGVVVSSGILLAIHKAVNAPTARQRLGIIAGMLLVLGGLWLTYQETAVFGAARGLAKSSLRGAASPVWDWNVYAQSFSGLIFQFSFLGILFFLLRHPFFAKVKPQAKIVLLCWFFVYLIGSRLPMVIEPGRLGRDLALAASVLAAIGLVGAWQVVKSNTVIRISFIATVTAAFLIAFMVKGGKLTRYEPMVRFTREDITLIQSLPTNQPVVLLDRENAWAEITKFYPGMPANVTILNTPKKFEQFFAAHDGCGYVSQYSSQVWIPDPGTPDYIETLSQNLGQSPIEVSTQPNKTWYRFCLSRDPAE